MHCVSVTTSLARNVFVVTVATIHVIVYLHVYLHVYSLDPFFEPRFVFERLLLAVLFSSADSAHSAD